MARKVRDCDEAAETPACAVFPERLRALGVPELLWLAERNDRALCGQTEITLKLSRVSTIEVFCFKMS